MAGVAIEADIAATAATATSARTRRTKRDGAALDCA
jgi:hypothetical protein